MYIFKKKVLFIYKIFMYIKNYIQQYISKYFLNIYIYIFRKCIQIHTNKNLTFFNLVLP